MSICVHLHLVCCHRFKQNRDMMLKSVNLQRKFAVISDKITFFALVHVLVLLVWTRLVWTRSYFNSCSHFSWYVFLLDFVWDSYNLELVKYFVSPFCRQDTIFIPSYIFCYISPVCVQTQFTYPLYNIKCEGILILVVCFLVHFL